MTDEEKKQLADLKEMASYYRAYSTSLRKELKDKDVEIGKLNATIQEFEDQKKLAKGDMKAFRKDMYVQELQRKNKALKKDNDTLICKLGLKVAGNDQSK